MKAVSPKGSIRSPGSSSGWAIRLEKGHTYTVRLHFAGPVKSFSIM